MSVCANQLVRSSGPSTPRVKSFCALIWSSQLIGGVSSDAPVAAFLKESVRSDRLVASIDQANRIQQRAIEVADAQQAGEVMAALNGPYRRLVIWIGRGHFKILIRSGPVAEPTEESREMIRKPSGRSSM